MKKSNHIHLRCPGNMGLMGSFVQILFPNKRKTAKYAGNWDPKSKQPLTYILQKKILSSTFLAKNIQVLVYGNWPNQSKNIKSFFTATYSDTEKKDVGSKSLDGIIEFLFVGTLTSGKQPKLAIQLAEKLKQKNYNVRLSIYGDGIERQNLITYIKKNKLSDEVFLCGNLDKEALKKVYRKSHFLLLPSKSEGWPKVVAEAMFWGCLPIATPVSCVSEMLGQGKRGIIINENLDTTLVDIEKCINSKELYLKMIEDAKNWSQQFTTDRFEFEIKRLLE